MPTSSKRIWLLITSLFALCIIAITFSQMLTDPGHLVTPLYGDAAKNMLAYLYQVIYGKGYWFTGMNYPYGEHIVYMDGQPLLSVTLSYFKSITISQALTVMWYSMLLSYFLAIIYVYKILVHFGVSEFIAMLFSGLIVVMCPQLLRSLGHFGLAYACVVPMLFYWTAKYYVNPHRKYALYILIMGLLATFIHPYFSAIVLLWVSFYAFGYFIFTSINWKQKVRHTFPLLLSIFLLFGIVSIFMKSTDPYKDRAATPYGMTVYCARGEHIFTSPYSPVWKFVDGNNGFVQKTIGDEGFTYLGITVIAAFVFSLIKGIINRRKKQSSLNIINNTGFKRVWLFIAFAALLLSMGVPFVWHMEWITTYLSFLRQFRSLGRFSWIFYYVMTIYGVVVIYTYYAKYLAEGKSSSACALLFSSLALWSFEASGYIMTERNAIGSLSKNYDELCGTNEGNWNRFLSGHHYKANDFQAMLLLRFFNEESDKLWVGGDPLQMEIGTGFVAAIQTHLPIIDAMAHSSWGITEKQVKIAGGPYAIKPMLNDLPDNKPFLLLNHSSDELDPDQKYILASSDFIGDNNSWHVYACYPDRIKANDKKYGDSIKAMIPFLGYRDTCLRCSGTWYVNHFDSVKTKDKFFGNGAQPQIMQLETVIADIPIKSRPANGQYEFSCWFLLGDENYRSPFFKLEFRDASGNIISKTDVLTKESTDNKGLWFRAYKFFTVPPECTSIKCVLYNEPDETYKIMDELLLRPVDALIISRYQDGAIMVNNHLLAQ